MSLSATSSICVCNLLTGQTPEPCVLVCVRPQGFTADVTLLRKMLTAVDRKLHEMRLVER